MRGHRAGARAWTQATSFVELPGGESDTERRARLDELPLATVSLSLSGDDSGELRAALPCEVAVERPADLGHADGGPQPLAWLVVRVESHRPVSVGSTPLTALSVAVPDYHGPDHYDLDELRLRAEADQVEWWEVDDFHLSPGPQGGDNTYYLDVDALPGAYVDVTDDSIAFDLPMASTVSEVRVTGSITWRSANEPSGTVVQIGRPR